MKKLIVLLALVAMTFQLQAQDQDMLKNIREVNGLTKSIDADLANTLVKSKKTTTQAAAEGEEKPKKAAAKKTTTKKTAKKADGEEEA